MEITLSESKFKKLQNQFLSLKKGLELIDHVFADKNYKEKRVN